MKKLILILSIGALGTITLQCREDDNNETATEKNLQKKSVDSISSNVHQTTHDIWELDPDPPVRDGQDWRLP